MKYFTFAVLLFLKDGVKGFQTTLVRHSGALKSTIRDTEVETGTLASLDTVRAMSERAILKRGTKDGLENMARLSQLCVNRVPFDFANNNDKHSGSGNSVISKVPGLIPPSITRKIFDKVQEMLEKGWMSTNADSVDGLPSFHLNLVSNGEPIVEGENLDDFQRGISYILDLVRPMVYDELLPHARAKLGTSAIEVSDIFIRRYGQDMIDGKSRNGISAHYDVFSRVTSVIALDDVAREGRNGLFTTIKADSVVECGEITSSHAALRRFFPLACGDAVVHSWDVLHGVDVEEGIDRTSLIVWFTEKYSDDSKVSPWLKYHPDLDRDNVAQFVLASAMESIEPQDSENKHPSTQSMHYGNKSKKNEGLSNVVDLYLSSSYGGNSFAMTRLGSLLEENPLDSHSLKRAKKVLNALRQRRLVKLPSWIDIGDNLQMSLARGMWYEAALCGNALAQTALADDIMATSLHEQDARLLAATLFGLAAQQGNEQAAEALSRVVQIDVEFNKVASQEEFEALAVVQTARAATFCL